MFGANEPICPSVLIENRPTLVAPMRVARRDPSGASASGGVGGMVEERFEVGWAGSTPGTWNGRPNRCSPPRSHSKIAPSRLDVNSLLPSALNAIPSVLFSCPVNASLTFADFGSLPSVMQPAPND